MSNINKRKAKPDTPEYAEVKETIVQASIELLAEKGLRKFRFDDLAEKISYNRATIYRYFDSKQGLIEEVMMSLMHQITIEIIKETTGTQRVTRKTFTNTLYNIITELRINPRYTIIMEAQNVEKFAVLTHKYFSAITTDQLEKYLTDDTSGLSLKNDISMGDAVHWLMHQIISYGFFGLKGDTEKQQKAYLEKMVISVII